MGTKGRPEKLDNEMREKGFIPSTEAARVAGVTIQCVYGWMRDGKVTSVSRAHIRPGGEEGKVFKYIRADTLHSHLATLAPPPDPAPEANA